MGGTMDKNTMTQIPCFVQSDEDCEALLDYTDQLAAENDRRMTHEEVFSSIRKQISKGFFCSENNSK